MLVAPAVFAIYIILGYKITGGGAVFYSSAYCCCLCWGMANGLPWGAFRWCSALLACENGLIVAALGMTNYFLISSTFPFFFISNFFLASATSTILAASLVIKEGGLTVRSSS